MSSAEQKVVDHVKASLASNGSYMVVFQGSRTTANGTPDILCCFKPTGMFIGIECKAVGGEPSIVQLRRGIEIIRAGGRFVLATSDFTLKRLECQLFKTVPVTIAAGSEFPLHKQLGRVHETLELVDSRTVKHKGTDEEKLHDNQ